MHKLQTKLQVKLQKLHMVLSFRGLKELSIHVFPTPKCLPPLEKFSKNERKTESKNFSFSTSWLQTKFFMPNYKSYRWSYRLEDLKRYSYMYSLRLNIYLLSKKFRKTNKKRKVRISLFPVLDFRPSFLCQTTSATDGPIV